jgi:hypothetical protein
MAIAERETPDCYWAISELDDAMRDSLGPWQRYFVLGGIASGALRHPDTVIDTATRTVIAAEGSGELTVRQNGTTRDIDILVDDVLTDETADRVKASVAEATGGALVVSVFGLDAHTPDTPASRLKNTATHWVSRRTIDENRTHRYELHPLSQAVPRESYEPWRLYTPDNRVVNIFNPAGHVLAYAMRSVSGVRAKDTDKLYEMTNNVLRHPELKDEIKEGVFRPWLDFAVAVYDMRDNTLPPDSPLIKEGTNRVELAAARWKGKLLHFIEDQERIVDIAQHERIQKLLNFVIRAK